MSRPVLLLLLAYLGRSFNSVRPGTCPDAKTMATSGLIAYDESTLPMYPSVDLRVGRRRELRGRRIASRVESTTRP